MLSIKVNAHGLAGLASGLKNLTELDVGGCERVDDSALRALCSMNAHFLNLSGCAAITEAGVAGIAMNCTALSSLNVTGCPGIGRRFIQVIAPFEVPVLTRILRLLCSFDSA